MIGKVLSIRLVASIIVFGLLSGCALQYRNPTDSSRSLIFGSYRTEQDVERFVEELGLFSNKPVKVPIVSVKSVDGKEVSLRDTPTYLAPGMRNVTVTVGNKGRWAETEFPLDVSPAQEYEIKYNLTQLDNTELAEVWIVNVSTEEEVSERKRIALQEAARQDTILIPIMLE